MVVKLEYRLLEVREDSVRQGLCPMCIHFIDGGCDTKRPCGQVLACRSQARALVFGRFPSGRVRQAPLKRLPSKKVVGKHAWKEVYARMKLIGDECGCVWISALNSSQQVSVRRFIKAGKMTAVHISDVFIRGVPALFISKDQLDGAFGEGKWEANYGE